MKKVLFHFAMWNEVPDFIKEKSKLVDGGNFGMESINVDGKIVHILVTGPSFDGILNYVDKFIQFPIIVNVGFCGANSKELKKGDVVQISKSYNYDLAIPNLPRMMSMTMDDNGNYGSTDLCVASKYILFECASSNAFVTLERLKADEMMDKELVFDMELWPLAKLFSARVMSYKIVSDNCSYEEYKESSEENINLSKVIEDVVKQLLIDLKL